MIEAKGFLCQFLGSRLVVDDKVIDECLPVYKEHWDYMIERVKNAKDENK